MKKKITIKSYLGVAIAATLITTIMRSISLLTVYDTAIGYYSRSSVLPYIHKALTLCAIIFFISYLFIEKKNILPVNKPSASHFSTFSSLLCGTVHISSAALLLMYQRGTTNTATLLILIGFSAAAIYFFYDALCPIEKKSPFSIFPAIVAVVGLIAVIVKLHLDYTTPLNSPNKTLIFLALASVSLFIIQDLRFTVEKPLPRFYFVSSCIAFLLCTSLSIPGIIGHYTNILSGGSFLIYYTVAFAYSVYIFSRMISYVKLSIYNLSKENSPEENISELSDQ